MRRASGGMVGAAGRPVAVPQTHDLCGTDRGIVRSLPHQVGGHGLGDPSVRHGSVTGGSTIGGTMCRHRPVPRATRAGSSIRKTAICPISLLPSSSVGEPHRIRLAQGRCMESARTGLPVSGHPMSGGFGHRVSHLCGRKRICSTARSGIPSAQSGAVIRPDSRLQRSTNGGR